MTCTDIFLIHDWKVLFSNDRLRDTTDCDQTDRLMCDSLITINTEILRWQSCVVPMDAWTFTVLALLKDNVNGRIHDQCFFKPSSRRRRWLGSLNYIHLHFFTNTHQATDILPPSTPQQLCRCPQWFVGEHTAGNPLGASQLTLVEIIITLGYGDRRHKCIWCIDAIHFGEYECLFSRGFGVSRLPWACLKDCYVGVRSPPSTCFLLCECAFVVNWFSLPVFRMWHCLSICTTALFSLIINKRCLEKKK